MLPHRRPPKPECPMQAMAAVTVGANVVVTAMAAKAAMGRVRTKLSVKT